MFKGSKVRIEEVNLLISKFFFWVLELKWWYVCVVSNFISVVGFRVGGRFGIRVRFILLLVWEGFKLVRGSGIV